MLLLSHSYNVALLNVLCSPCETFTAAIHLLRTSQCKMHSLSDSLSLITAIISLVLKALAILLNSAECDKKQSLDDTFKDLTITLQVWIENLIGKVFGDGPETYHSEWTTIQQFRRLTEEFKVCFSFCVNLYMTV